ncbi:MAG: hypothetical protein ACF8XB_23545 [Planctomycetota bacterium JB042]
MRISRIVVLSILAASVGAGAARAEFTSVLKKKKLVLTQIVDDGPVTVDDNGTDGAFRILEGDTTEFEAADSLEIELLSGSHPNLDVDIDQGIARDLTVRIGSGTRVVSFVGDANTVAGHVRVLGEDGDQVVELAVAAPFSCAGKLVVKLGEGFDQVDENGFDVTIGGDLVFGGVNAFENDGEMRVGGDASITSDELVATEFDNDDTMLILGDFDFSAGKGGGSCQLNDVGVTVGGDTVIDCGSSAAPHFVGLQNSRFGGDLEIDSDSSLATFVTMDAATFVGGSIEIEVGKGSATLILAGFCNGKSVEIEGSKGVDTVVASRRARRAKGDFDRNKGDDTVNLVAPATFKRLSIDFDGGNDTFVDGLGEEKPFDLSVDDLP